jgi:hypothetical protein
LGLRLVPIREKITLQYTKFRVGSWPYLQYWIRVEMLARVKHSSLLKKYLWKNKLVFFPGKLFKPGLAFGIKAGAYKRKTLCSLG